MSRRDPWAGILSGPVDGPARLRATYPEVVGTLGLRARHRGSGFTGAVARWERDGLVLRGASGLERIFVATPGGFDLEGRAVTLVRPTAAPRAPVLPAMTASGSLAVAGARARVARATRILVEGVHDAELVERVWGDDLRVEGVVVERLDGIDDLAGVVARFGLGPSGPRSGVDGPSGPRSGVDGPSGPRSGVDGPSGPWSGVDGPSGPRSGVEGPSGPRSGVEGPSGPRSGVEGPSGPWSGVEGPGARLGVLVDHLVPGSKEARLAAEVAHPHVLVTGTPYVDVWEAVKPAAVGIPAWPAVPRGVDWKAGVCARLGVDPAGMWPRILASVRSYADLEPALVGAVERLIDFVTEAD